VLVGELRHIHKLRFWPLDDVLKDKYLLSKDEARMIASFLNSMLNLHPDHRSSAAEMVNHPLIAGIVVQGEIDQMVRAEEESKKRAVDDVVSPATETPIEAVLMDPEPVSAPKAEAGKKKKKKGNKRVNAALANADADAIVQAEATVAQRQVDDANAMKPVEDLDEDEANSQAPISRSQVNVARDRTTSAQRSGST
jgi:serine/threonine-protein kinase SRPK3